MSLFFVVALNSRKLVDSRKFQQCIENSYISKLCKMVSLNRLSTLFSIRCQCSFTFYGLIYGILIYPFFKTIMTHKRQRSSFRTITPTYTTSSMTTLDQLKPTWSKEVWRFLKFWNIITRKHKSKAVVIKGYDLGIRNKQLINLI